MKIKHDELKKQFNILLDFFQNDSNRDYKLMSCYRSSFIPAPCPNFDRYNSKGYGSSTSVYFDSDIFRNTIISTLNTYVTFKKIYDIIIDINPTFLPKKDLKEDLNSKPSITTNIIAGFIAKVYDLKINNETAITDAFNHTFDSLIYFLKHDNVQINTLISLDGPSGILDEISLNESFKIKKANYNIVKEFSLLYNQVLSPIQNVIHENDYYLEINHVINKHDYQDYYNSQNKIIDKLFNIIAISDVGNIEKGKRIIKTDAWPLCLPKRGSAPIQTEDKYNIKNKFIFYIDSEDNFKKSFTNLIDIDFEKLDPKILASLRRLIKAKSQLNIQDRIIELVLALEYLINTERYEVSFQIKLKVVKLLEKKFNPKYLYEQTREFIKLRGDVFHGNKNIDPTPKNIERINNMEKIINKALIEFLKRTKKYSHKEINKALDKALYYEEDLETILDKND